MSMSRPPDTSALEVSELTLCYDQFQALRGVSLSVAPGEFVALLGPSGCGKTSLLRSIAGFAHPKSGSICLGGRNVIDLAPKDRNIGLVFQNYALFPHLTVAENVAFGLKCRGISKSETDRRVAEAIEMVGLSSMASRRPKQLSGGQQQRVALARAIVIEPDILLLDEPLGALDRQLRVQMQTELRALQKRLGIAAVFVTHDQEEAMSMADRIAVMCDGMIQQIDVPANLFRRPRTSWVSEFMGAGNLLEGECRTDVNHASLVLAPGCVFPLPAADMAAGEKTQAFVLSDRIHVFSAKEGEGLEVVGQRFLGLHVEIVIAHGEKCLRVLVDPEQAAATPIGSRVNLTADPVDLYLFNA